MITYFLGKEEVYSYVRDLIKRLAQSDPAPDVWCALTESGVNLLKIMVEVAGEVAPDLLEKVNVVSAYPVEEPESGFKFAGEGEIDFKDRSVLLFDSAVHGGSTMFGALTQIKQKGAKRICTYALVLKRGSAFIPTLWGVMINDEDRAYFLLDETPNNRLTTHRSEKKPYVNIRRLVTYDLSQKHEVVTDTSLDRTEWEDRLFDMATSELNPCTYLLENDSRVVGYLTIRVNESGQFHIAEVAVCKTEQGKGYGDVLMRFADTLARQSRCRRVKLHAIEGKIDFYKKCGYEAVGGAQLMSFGEESYLAMEKVLLYHSPANTKDIH